jgi:hypothetical protein
MKTNEFLDNLNNAVRENPVAAGLIGMGVAWIVFGRSGSVAHQAYGALRTTRDTLSTAVDGTAGAIRSTVAGTADQVSKAGAGVGDAISRGFQGAGSMMSDAVEGLKAPGNKPKAQSEFGRHYPAPQSSRFADLLERQPLALGAVGLAVGAAIASAFPSTDAEGRLMGAAGQGLRETAADATDTLIDKAVSVIDETTKEAVAQNLTPKALKEGALAGVAKLKTVARAGLEAREK